MWFEEEEAYRNSEIRVLAHELVVHVVNRLEKRVYAKSIEYDDEMAELDDLFARLRDDSIDIQLDDGLYMSNLRCDACNSDESWIWRRVAKRKLVCSRCFQEKTYLILFDDEHLIKKSRTNSKDAVETGNAIIQNSISLSTSTLTSNHSNSNSSKKSKNKNKKSQNIKSEPVTNNGSNNNGVRPLTRTARKVNGEPNTTPSVQSGPPTLQTQLSTSSNSSLVSNSANGTAAESAPAISGGATSSTEMEVDSATNNSTMTRKSARILKSKQNEIITTNNGQISSGQDIKQEEEEAESTATMTVAPVATTTENKPTNRRTKMFKKKSKPPVRCQTTISRLTTSDYVFHKGFYLQVGDIVALLDRDDQNNFYFAQIRAFLVDDLGQKSAMITWLVPTSQQHKQIKKLKDFEASLFVLGPAEELPRPLDQMEFVRRLDDPMTLVPAAGTRNYHESNAHVTSDQLFDLLARYKSSLFKHKLAVSDSATSSHNMPLVVTRSYFSNETNENLLVETEIQCK